VVDLLTLVVMIALFVLALAVRFYPWHDPRKFRRTRLAAWVAWGALFGLLALSFYLSYAHGRPVPIWRIAAPLGAAGIITSRRTK
jgi:threonine/homoserine efflux transporter RhtA